MKIYIPSLHRMDQRTWEAIPRIWRKNTYVICPYEDSKKLKKKYPEMQIILQPMTVQGIAQVRQHILNICSKEKLVMMDDDLRFSTRITDTTKLRQSKIHDINEMLVNIEDQLNNYIHLAVSAREGNNRVEELITEIGRPLRVLAYNTPKLPSGVFFERIRVMEDFDMTLQLLRKGFKNAILWQWAHDQVGGSQAPGGCSTYRNEQTQTVAAFQLAEYHPGFVKVVEKEGWRGMVKRTDVKIAWKKAYDSSRKKLFVLKKRK